MGWIMQQQITQQRIVEQEAMLKLVQPNRASCLPTAFASVLGVNVEAIFAFLGHDGMERVWPDAQPPMCYRSFHIQEMYEYTLTRNYMVTTIAPAYATLPDGISDPYIVQSTRFQEYLQHYICVLTGVSERGHAHAVAWDGTNMMDPSSGLFVSLDFTINHIHIVSHVEQWIKK